MDMKKYAGSESKYLRATDLQNKRPNVVIESVGLLEFDDEEKGQKVVKPTLKFRGKEKELVLNPTNTDELGQAYGWDSDGWIGKEIQLSTKFYKNFGKEGIIVLPVRTEQDELDDKIPF